MARTVPIPPLKQDVASRQITDAEYNFVRELVYERSRINLGDRKRELVMARLSKRLRALDLPTYKAYLDLLKSPTGKEELTHFIDSISTNHTYFFRERQHFDFLAQHILPTFTKQGGRIFRLWSAAASTGEEPYSLAILLEDYFASHPGEWSMLCTDISTRALAGARQGVYPEQKLRDIPKETIARHFDRGVGASAGLYRISTKLQQKMRFQALNLLGPPYPMREAFECVFCRNVMIYFDRPTQQELVQRITPLLQPGGYFMIGHAESLSAIQHSLKPLRPAIFQRPAA